MSATDARSASRDRLQALPCKKEETERSEGSAKKSGNRRHLRLKRYADKLAPALLHGASSAGSFPRFSQCGGFGALRAMIICSRIPMLCFTVLGMTNQFYLQSICFFARLVRIFGCALATLSR